MKVLSAQYVSVQFRYLVAGNRFYLVGNPVKLEKVGSLACGMSTYRRADAAVHSRPYLLNDDTLVMVQDHNAK